MSIRSWEYRRCRMCNTLRGHIERIRKANKKPSNVKAGKIVKRKLERLLFAFKAWGCVGAKG